jgi:GNAT superfamily N-acetyltransferase
VIRDASVMIRGYEERDFDDLVRRWHETNQASYPYVALHRQHTLDDARHFFRRRVLPACEVWVAHDETQLRGLLALEAPWIRQFAVFPEHQRRGVGTRLLARARASSPGELRLFTFRRNAPARAFYEKHGFAAVAFGVSPAPESEPDVEYHWTP